MKRLPTLLFTATLAACSLMQDEKQLVTPPPIPDRIQLKREKPIPSWAQEPDEIRELPASACLHPLTILGRGTRLPAECDFGGLLVDLREYPEVAYDTGYFTEGLFVLQPVAVALDQMFAGARADGVDLILKAAYRSYTDQATVWDEWVHDFGEDKAQVYTFRPGHSEHHLGTSVDFGWIDPEGNPVFGPNFFYTEQYRWLVEHAHEYGFFFRYPVGQEAITKVGGEIWHLRWLPKGALNDFADSGFPTFDEWVASLSEAEYNSYTYTELDPLN